MQNIFQVLVPHVQYWDLHLCALIYGYVFACIYVYIYIPYIPTHTVVMVYKYTITTNINNKNNIGFRVHIGHYRDHLCYQYISTAITLSLQSLQGIIVWGMQLSLEKSHKREFTNQQKALNKLYFMLAESTSWGFSAILILE